MLFNVSHSACEFTLVSLITSPVLKFVNVQVYFFTQEVVEVSIIANPIR